MVTLYGNRRRETSFDNGIIYPIVEVIIKYFVFLNIVELIKKITEVITKAFLKGKPERVIKLKVRRNKGIIVDVFIIFKFYFLLYILYANIGNIWVQAIVWYLLISNLFTYFYYHLWCEDALFERYQTLHRVRRRFINLFVSIAFMILCYVYFYAILTPVHFTLVKEQDNKIFVSTLNSIAKSFAIDFEGMSSKTNMGFIIEITQVLNSFIFIAILLAKSLPKADQN